MSASAGDSRAYGSYWAPENLTDLRITELVDISEDESEPKVGRKFLQQASDLVPESVQVVDSRAIVEILPRLGGVRAVHRACCLALQCDLLYGK